ncbi:MAG TPA: hypothetical protein VKZ53_01675 [Candidatus Angelobacter sp.]|nr:hypothetical protein [Candidatus Angelobacter sp.]
MTEVKDCLPETARKHFINLRNVLHDATTEKYQTRLRDFRAQILSQNQGRSGLQQIQEWKLKEQHLESLTIEYVEAAIETCKLYEISLTQPLCNCLIKAAGDFLDIQFRRSLELHSQGIGGVKVPLSVRQQGNLNSVKIMNRIKVAVETARVEDARKRNAMPKEGYGDIYNQHIVQNGGVLNASQTGNISVQQITTTALNDLRPELAQMRAFFKKQEESVDTDEYVGLLASAEKAADEKDENKMLGYLKQIPGKAWEIGKAVIPPMLLHYLKAHDMAE